jgi:hypothetical protein
MVSVFSQYESAPSAIRDLLHVLKAEIAIELQSGNPELDVELCRCILEDSEKLSEESYSLLENLKKKPKHSRSFNLSNFPSS